MLNFNRTFEQEMLFKEESIFADDIYNNAGEIIPPKTIEDSILSFLNMLEKNLKNDLENDERFKKAKADKGNAEKMFKIHFMKKYHLNLQGEVISNEEIEKLEKIGYDDVLDSKQIAAFK